MINVRSIPTAGLVGVPYKAGGRDGKACAQGGDGGLDCYGLARAALMRVGVPLPTDQRDGGLFASQHGEIIWARKESGEQDAMPRLKAADLLVMSLPEPGQKRRAHVGVVVQDGGGRMLHTISVAAALVGVIKSRSCIDAVGPWWSSVETVVRFKPVWPEGT